VTGVYRSLGGKREDRDHLGDLGIGKRTVLLDLEKYSVRA